MNLVLKNILLLFVIIISTNSYAVSSVKEDSQHVNAWNAFADNVYQLHQFNLKNVSIRTEQDDGGYSGKENFFEETRYYDDKSGNLLSRIQREKSGSNKIHLIEVFIYDQHGRVKIDYLAAFLPDFRNAPIQTLISIHRYNDLLHAFRQFDASGALINEQCEGELFNEKVFITLDEDEIINRHEILVSDIETNQYHSCFEFLPKQAGDYLSPSHLIADSTNDDQNEISTTLQALSNLIESDNSDNQSGLNYLKRADLYFQQGQFSKAVSDYTQALKHNDHLDEAYFGRGMALGRQGLVQQGVDDLGVYIKRHPYNSRAYTKRGVRYIWLGNTAAAKKDLLEAVSLDNTNAEAHDDLGVVYASNNNFDKAIYHFKQSIYYDRTYQKAYHNLSMAYVVTGKFNQALLQVDKGLLLQSDNRNTLLLKSTILEKLGKIKEANSIREHAEFLPEGNWSERYSLN